MCRQFSKKTIFLKFISGSVLFSFIFTGIPVRSYAAVYPLSGNLRARAEKQGQRNITGIVNEMNAAGTAGISWDTPEAISNFTKQAELADILEKRNKENKSNFPADIRREDEKLFNTLKDLRIPIYSKQDEAIYVWDTDGLEKALQEQYAQGKNDEAMISIITIGEDGWPKSRLAEGGDIFNFAYREDRQRQWVDRVLKEIPNLSIFAMTQYVPGLPMNRVILPDKIVENSLPELLWKNDVPLIWVLDAEKSGLTLSALRGRKTPFPNEDLEYASISMPVLMTDEQVRSGNFNPDLVLQLEDKQYIAWFYKGVPKGLNQIPNNEYWRYPGLSAFAVAYADINKIKAAERGCIYTNISVPDLIGHVAIKNINKKAKLFIQNKDGKFEIREGNGWDSVKACLNISDTCIQMIIEALKEKKGKMVLLGDHGSVDDMSQPNHSFNQVPIFIIDTENEEVEVIKGTGTQADAAATVAHILDIKKPANKSGKSLLPDSYVGRRDKIVLTNLLDGFGHTDFDDPETITNNAFGVAMKEGLMPTIKGLYDKKNSHGENNYQLLEACGYLAGLRGGRQKDFPKKDIITTRDGMLKRIEEIKPQAIQIILYDYQDIKGAVSKDYDYAAGLKELKDSPFLNDKDFVIVNDPENNKVKVLCLDYPQMGSTEYNTWTIGAMEIVEQSVVLLDKLFISGEIFETKALKTFLQNAQKKGEAHFSGILQEAAVHSSVRHLYYLIKYLKENGVKRFAFHLASDGRDEGKQDCLARIRQLRAALKYLEINDYDLDIRGRELCFDRANNMELTGAWINELLYGSRISKEKNTIEDTVSASKIIDSSD